MRENSSHASPKIRITRVFVIRNVEQLESEGNDATQQIGNLRENGFYIGAHFTRMEPWLLLLRKPLYN
jgi:hypothetical protein